MTMKRVLRSSAEPTPRKLAWWDTLRLLVHGTIVIASADLEVLHEISAVPPSEGASELTQTSPIAFVRARSLQVSCSSRSLEASAEGVLLSVPNEPRPGMTHGDGERTILQILAWPQIQVTAGLKWDCTEPYGHHVQLGTI